MTFDNDYEDAMEDRIGPWNPSQTLSKTIKPMKISHTTVNYRYSELRLGLGSLSTFN